MPKAYAVMWLSIGDHPGEMVNNALVYRFGGKTEVRTYFEGHLDPRAGDESEMPRFDNIHDVMTFWTSEEGRGQKALVEVSVAKKIRPDAYADPV